MREREREILLSLAYQGKEDKKDQTAHELALSAPEFKIEIDEPWVAWLSVYKQIKGSTKVLASLVSTYLTFLLHLQCHVDAGIEECQELSLILLNSSPDL
jgi:hypothetical protein